ncbi:hypothetical protein J6590_038083 [Homalodisca vitripennis]|nr:hypothetical protein J6590_038083 [Homalodisca vitripennis]
MGRVMEKNGESDGEEFSQLPDSAQRGRGRGHCDEVWKTKSFDVKNKTKRLYTLWSTRCPKRVVMKVAITDKYKHSSQEVSASDETSGNKGTANAWCKRRSEIEEATPRCHQTAGPGRQHGTPCQPIKRSYRPMGRNHLTLPHRLYTVVQKTLTVGGSLGVAMCITLSLPETKREEGCPAAVAMIHEIPMLAWLARCLEVVGHVCTQEMVTVVTPQEHKVNVKMVT